jgi:hypothetical protein
MAQTFSGEMVEIGQWQLYVDDAFVGYLPHADGSRILPIAGFNFDKAEEIAAECSRIRESITGTPSETLPPTMELKEVLDALQAKNLLVFDEGDEEDEEG